MPGFAHIIFALGLSVFLTKFSEGKFTSKHALIFIVNNLFGPDLAGFLMRRRERAEEEGADHIRTLFDSPMIGIVDYGMGNISSVAKALEKVGGEVQVVTTASQLRRMGKIVLPGVAAFGDAMEQLRRMGLVDPLVDAVREGVPYLGFCLGLQLLFDVSYENGQHTGLGILSGKVVRFQFDASVTGQRLSVPHMGWNNVRWSSPCPMLEGVAGGSFFYFAHSYHVVPADDKLAVATTEYGYPFVSAVWKDNIFATQFHPEKSQAAGLAVLRNFVET